MRHRSILIGLAIVVVSFVVTTTVLNSFFPVAPAVPRPALVAVPPLAPMTGTSVVLTPAAVSIAAIRDALEANAPRNLSGKPQNPVGKLLANADLNFTINRGPFSLAGQPGALVITTPLNGTFQARGTLTGAVGSLGNNVGSFVGGNLGQAVQSFSDKAFDQHADIQGSVTTTARPSIAANWRLAPNLAAQVNVADVVLPVAGVKLSVANQVKPVLDASVREQTGALESRLRNDPFIETAARAEWAKLCRATSLGAAGPGMPKLWLEVRPVRAIAAQPTIDSNAVTLLVGVQAQTRIVPNETKPDCPFPQTLDLVPQDSGGRVNIGVPIDIPFTEVSRLLEAQFAGRTFPEDRSGSFAARIKQATVEASGDRLLISLLVHVNKSGALSFFGADATVHVWGRPVLDQDRQILRFADVALDVQSQAAFGLLGAAAQAAAPYLQKILADQAVIDLKPFAADARKRIAAAIGGLAAQTKGLSAKVAVDDLRLTGIAYDDKTLRVITSATGNVSVAISSLALQ
jgi:Domain of unknown function (DUF4403)